MNNDDERTKDELQEKVARGLLPPEVLDPEERELFRPFDAQAVDRIIQQVLALNRLFHILSIAAPTSTRNQEAEDWEKERLRREKMTQAARDWEDEWDTKYREPRRPINEDMRQKYGVK